MKRKLTLALLLLIVIIQANAQSFDYKIDLNKGEKDQLFVELKCPTITKSEIIYYFPKTVPGTYSQQDYGRYISDFKAYSRSGEELKAKKIDINSFLISDATTIATIKYTVDDTWDEKVKKKQKIFEPAGTGFEKGEYYIFNNGGMFGCIEEMEESPFRIKITGNNTLVGYSSLEKIKTNQEVLYKAKSYHQLIDSPILYTAIQPEFIEVGGCKVTIASFGSNDSTSIFIKKELEPLFKAIEKFTGDLPVKEYNILVYTKEMTEIGELLSSEKLGLFKIIKLIKATKGLGVGALEHGTSSFYYLPNFGSDEGPLAEFNYTGMISQIVAHEFMHIYTPLNLHSQQIGKFNYREPKMSKHLWLYEGVTEYFSLLIQMQGNIETVENTLYKTIKDKIKTGEKYTDSIAFTRMSENVFDKPYSDLYIHVYDRGAIMAMLLDIEIMNLTDGNTTLKQVLFDLSSEYGQDKSFDENSFIAEFVNHVDPKLQSFFDDYVTGTKPLDIENGFNTIGIIYKTEIDTLIPINIFSKKNNGVKTKMLVKNNKRNIKKVTDKDIVGLKKGDKVDRDEAYNCFLTDEYDFVAEGEIISLKIMRDNKEIELKFPAKYREGTLHNYIKIKKEKTEKQQRLFNIWTGNIK